MYLWRCLDLFYGSTKTITKTEAPGLFSKICQVLFRTLGLRNDKMFGAKSRLWKLEEDQQVKPWRRILAPIAKILHSCFSADKSDNSCFRLCSKWEYLLVGASREKFFSLTFRELARIRKLNGCLHQRRIGIRPEFE